ncbi:MAG: DUF692 domain-containing protein [Alphaproteobacteria bacterium]|jgi:uncharacterized protein (UPF0276 family)|nr:DUF692 domain-containing protein [Alphaproteobacteria bacterium]
MTFVGLPPRQASAGIGLRHAHYDQFTKEKQPVAWLEVHAENFLNFDTPAFKMLERIRQDYPLSLHAVNLSLGSSDGIDEDHVKRVKGLIDRLNPFIVSDHLSWGRIDGYYLNDLLPIPYTKESLDVFDSNISRIQDLLERSLLIENPSSYLQFKASEIEEADFLTTLVNRTGSSILLDVNNIYVSCCNHGWDAEAYLNAIPAALVKEIHLAGHTLQGSIRIDDHGSKVCHEVWELYQKALTAYGPVPTLIEWDTKVPELGILLAEASKAQNLLDSLRVPSNSPRKQSHVSFG